MGKTFEEVYCARNGTTATGFRRAVFWRCLHPGAVALAPLLFLSGYFALDRDLVAACGQARNFRQVCEELDDYRHSPRNRGLLRRRLNVRLSTTRLRQIARQYLDVSAVGGGRRATAQQANNAP